MNDEQYYFCTFGASMLATIAVIQFTGFYGAVPPFFIIAAVASLYGAITVSMFLLLHFLKKIGARIRIIKPVDESMKFHLVFLACVFLFFAALLALSLYDGIVADIPWFETGIPMADPRWG